MICMSKQYWRALRSAGSGEGHRLLVKARSTTRCYLVCGKHCSHCTKVRPKHPGYVCYHLALLTSIGARVCTIVTKQWRRIPVDALSRPIVSIAQLSIKMFCCVFILYHQITKPNWWKKLTFTTAREELLKMCFLNTSLEKIYLSCPF